MSTTINSIHLNVKLGNSPSFAVEADDRPNIAPGACKFTGGGDGAKDNAKLQRLLAAIGAAYSTRQSMTLTLNGNLIVL